MGKIIAVTSGKGGTGKTTTAAAISSCLASLGHKTLSIDFDFRLKNLDLSLCIKTPTSSDLADIAVGRATLLEACIEHERIEGLFYLLTPPSFDSFNSYDSFEKKIEALGIIFDEIREEFDYCIIDLPAGLGVGFKLGHTFADTSLIVVTGETPAIRNAKETALAINTYGIKTIRLLVNRVIEKDFRWLHQTIDDIIDTTGVQLIGVIQEDKAVFRALHSNTPLMLYKKRQRSVQHEFMDAARRINGEDIPLRLY